MRTLDTGPRTAPLTPSASPPPLVSSDVGSRIASLDIIRGAVVVLMAIDHVRVYSGLPAGGPTPTGGPTSR